MAPDTDQAEIDQLQALALQLFAALFFLFMIAVAMNLKRQQYLEQTPQGQAVATRDAALIDLQFQRLLQQLAVVEAEERQRLALDLFTESADAPESFRVAAVVTEGAPSGPLCDEFSRGCRHAAGILVTLTHRDALQSDWLKRVIRDAGLHVPRGLTFIGDDPDAVTDENFDQIRQEIFARTAALHDQTVALHRAVREEVYAHYLVHPHEVRDAELASIIRQYDELRQQENATPDPELAQRRGRLVAAIHRRLEDFVQSIFGDHDAPLLSEGAR